MWRFFGRRAASGLVILLILSFVVFVLQYVSPGDPARAYVGANASNETVAAERERLGLTDPFFTQYFRYLGHLVTGQLGRSLRTRNSVTTDIATYLPATVQLVVTAFLIALVLATLFAISAARRWPGASLGRGLLLLLATAPPFLLALVGIIVFFGRLDWLPARGAGDYEDPGPTGMLVVDTLLHGQVDAFLNALQHLILPALVLSIAPAVAIGRIFRASLQGVQQVDFVRTARSKGLTERRILRRHVVRNAIGPGLAMAGLQLGFMFAGVVVVEQVFSWPGIGNYLAASIPVDDFPAIAGVTLVLGAIYIVANVIVDLLQAVADPRVAAE